MKYAAITLSSEALTAGKTILLRDLEGTGRALKPEIWRPENRACLSARPMLAVVGRAVIATIVSYSQGYLDVIEDVVKAQKAIIVER